MKTLDSYWAAAEKEDKARASLSNRKVTYMSSLKDSADVLKGKDFATRLLKTYYSTTASRLSSEACVDQMRYDYTKQNLEPIRKARGGR